MGECLLRKTKNTERVYTLKFVVMVERKSLEICNRFKIEGYDDWEVVAKWVNDLSKYGLIGVGN